MSQASATVNPKVLLKLFSMYRDWQEERVEEISRKQVVDKIKLLTYRWLKEKHVCLPLNYHGWWLSPFSILGIG
ncbi:hypothetical protein MtrunA17_Chr5g0405261 [Medicago truncatula]|uniref:Uncharacterized protein n=1 Tax=Medicago truncatula TaxID=3880 RepID=A0A396HLT8_MEDTR|nr:hypothetical protein MtrunA17_Chr5g0405261 [Medicago truncatula]